MLEVDLFERLETTIAAMKWTGSENKIFGTVSVALDFDISKLSIANTPCCFIIDEGSTPYRQHDSILEQGFTLRIVAGSKADKHGRGSLLGANRVSSTDSRGAGIYHIMKEVTEQLRVITSLSSARISLKGSVKPKPGKIASNFPYLIKDYKFSARVTTDSGSSPDEEEIIRSPGFLYADPSNIAAGEYGTLLGYMNDSVLFIPDYDLVPLTVQDTGSIKKKLMYRGGNFSVVAEFLNWNSATISKCFTGSTSGDSLIFPGSLKTGADFFTSHTMQLLFVPDDLTNNNIWLFYKVAPVIAERIRVGRGTDSVLRCIFQATTDGSNRMVYAGKVGNLP